MNRLLPYLVQLLAFVLIVLAFWLMVRSYCGWGWLWQ